jgi:hypothetical protein
MQSTLTVTFNLGDIQAAVLSKFKTMIASAQCQQLAIGLNIKDDKPIAGLVMEQQHIQEALIEVARNKLGTKYTTGTVNVEITREIKESVNDAENPVRDKILGAQVHFKYEGEK